MHVKTRRKIVRTAAQIAKLLAFPGRMSGIEPGGDLQRIDRDLRRLQKLAEEDPHKQFERVLGRFQAAVLKYALHSNK
jgi:DNA-binding XRE family transcriptional regulator